MKRFISFIKKNYIYLNITYFGLMVYIILFPLVSKLIQKVIPTFGKCPYLAFTGKPCPLCGGTRYIEGLPNVFHDITYLFNPFGIIILVIMVQFFFRMYLIITRKKERSTKWMTIDVIIQILLILLLIMYEVIFFIKQNTT